MNTGHLDGQGLAELRNFNFQNLTSAPTNNVFAGRFYFNSTDNTLYVYNGTEWIDALSQGDYTFQNGIELISGTRNVQIKVATGDNAGNVIFTVDSNGLKGEVPVLTIDESSEDYLEINDYELSVNVDTSVTENSKNLITSGAVAAAIGLALTGALKYQTVWTATGQSDYSSITLPVEKGYMYPVSGSATIDGIEWNAGDYLVINKDISASGTITSADVDKIDNTEASDIVRLNAIQTLTNKTIDADDNTISNLETDNFKSGVVRISTDGIRDVASASDTALVTEKNISTVLANKVYTTQNTVLSTVGGVCNFVVTHNLNNRNVGVFLYEVSTGDRVMYDYTITSENVVTVKILSTNNIAANTYKAVILG